MAIDLKLFKSKLETEKKRLEEELESLASKNPKNPNDWEASYDKSEGDDTVMENEPDPSDMADILEDLQERESLVNDVLEVRLVQVNAALAAIENNKYGLCQEGYDHPIEERRLEANPAALTCLKHIKSS
ncbi:MAG: hypothetical protein WC797_01315 [Candidatus Paceibacterota bacterium]|jgi:RNA polymerase-binding transcription factor DksA